MISEMKDGKQDDKDKGSWSELKRKENKFKNSYMELKSDTKFFY